MRSHTGCTPCLNMCTPKRRRLSSLLSTASDTSSCASLWRSARSANARSLVSGSYEIQRNCLMAFQFIVTPRAGSGSFSGGHRVEDCRSEDQLKIALRPAAVLRPECKQVHAALAVLGPHPRAAAFDRFGLRDPARE